MLIIAPGHSTESVQMEPKICYVKAQGMNFALATYTGTVLQERTNSETEIRQHADTYLPNGKVKSGSVYSVTHRMNEVWLRLDSGEERRYEQREPHVPVREGHRVSFLSVFPIGGPINEKCWPVRYGVRNHTTGVSQVNFVDSTDFQATKSKFHVPGGNKLFLAVWAGCVTIGGGVGYLKSSSHLLGERASDMGIGSMAGGVVGLIVALLASLVFTVPWLSQFARELDAAGKLALEHAEQPDKLASLFPLPRPTEAGQDHSEQGRFSNKGIAATLAGLFALGALGISAWKQRPYDEPQILSRSGSVPVASKAASLAPKHASPARPQQEQAEVRPSPQAPKPANWDEYNKQQLARHEQLVSRGPKGAEFSQVDAGYQEGAHDLASLYTLYKAGSQQPFPVVVKMMAEKRFVNTLGGMNQSDVSTLLRQLDMPADVARGGKIAFMAEALDDGRAVFALMQSGWVRVTGVVRSAAGAIDSYLLYDARGGATRVSGDEFVARGPRSILVTRNRVDD